MRQWGMKGRDKKGGGGEKVREEARSRLAYHGAARPTVVLRRRESC